MGIFFTKKLKQQMLNLQNAVAALNDELSQKSYQYNNAKAESDKLKAELDKIKSEIPKEQKDFLKLESDSRELQKQIESEKQMLCYTKDQKREIQDEIGKLQEKQAIETDCLDDIKKSVTEHQAALDKLILNIQKAEALYKSYKSANKSYEKDDTQLPPVFVPEDLMPLVTADLNCLNTKDLRSRYQANQKAIKKITDRYAKKYTTKSNIAIYKLMVIAMEAELQNVLMSLSHGNLDKAISNISSIIARYYNIAIEGNQTIAPSMKSFIAEIESLFIDTVNIEYEYYVKKERIKEEQRALREQMRQEAEERKALEEERKKVEKEESKYTNEIQQLTDRMKDADDAQIAALNERIKQLQEQLANVQKKKEDIINLQNGKAGYVYVISNLGSFGDSVFKVGMTRRLDPMERVKELGDASVPFSFDVHSFIFSDDAVGLEKTLHQELSAKRVNKVNLRKEFFCTSVDELEKLVLKHYPSAEFKRTMLAEQYRQSQAISKPLNDLTDTEETAFVHDASLQTV